MLLFEYVLTTSICRDTEGKRFRPNIRVMHMRDLNFMLRSEIFVNFDEKLRASHLILGCTLVYTSYQPFGQALLVNNPVLSYIDVQHPNFLPPNLAVGEARNLGPRLVRPDLLVPEKDASVDSIFQGCAVHIPVEETRVEVRSADQEEVELKNSSGAEVEQTEDEMVVR